MQKPTEEEVKSLAREMIEDHHQKCTYPEAGKTVCLSSGFCKIGECPGTEYYLEHARDILENAYQICQPLRCEL